MRVENIPLSEIIPDKNNPRKTFRDEDLKELADNIKQQGLLQPITVRPKTSSEGAALYDQMNPGIKYIVVCGERRFRAVLINGETSIAAIVRDMNDAEAFDAMITENLQRKDVDPVEEAYAFDQLTKNGSSIEDIAARFGKSVRFITDRIKLNNLIPELLLRVREGTMSINAGLIISKLDEDKQREFFETYGHYTNLGKEIATSYTSRLFMVLGSAVWADKPKFTGGCGKMCSQCECNTANNGCLFWELQDTNGKCTNRKGFDAKTISYVKNYIMDRWMNIVHEGEGLQDGKIAVIDNVNGYLKGRQAAMRNTILDELKDIKVEIFRESDFRARCWADAESETVKEGLANGEMMECVNLFDFSGEIHPTLTHYWVKVESAEMTPQNSQKVEVARLIDKYKSTKTKAAEKKATFLKDLAQEIELPKTDIAMSQVEAFVFDCLILNDCGRDLQNKYGCFIGDKDSLINAVKKNQHDRGIWYRDYIRHKLGYSMYNGSVNAKLAEMLFLQWDGDKVEKFTKRLEDDTLKKLEKIKEQLKELGYNGELS